MITTGLSLTISSICRQNWAPHWYDGQLPWSVKGYKRMYYNSIIVENTIRGFHGYFRGGTQGFYQGGILGCFRGAAQGFYGGYRGVWR